MQPQLPWGAMACACSQPRRVRYARLAPSVPRIALQSVTVEHPIGGQFTFTVPRNRLTISWT